VSRTVQLLIIKTGTTEPKVIAEHGDYDDWFCAHSRPRGVREQIVRAWQGEPLPRVDRFDGIILTGSPASVRDEIPWMAELGAWTLSAAASGTPVLAICFGHQLVGEALGGYIEPNPAGPEIGSIEIQLTPEGQTEALFEGLPTKAIVQSTHRDALTTPPSATLLASTENTEWQAFGWGRFLRAVQFHPEIPSEALTALCKVRGIDALVEPRSHGPQILDNWLKHYLLDPTET
jgi:GMP synthase (glutamine-hydrolysing)